MKTIRSSRMVRNLVLALAGAFIFAGVANAQAAYAGTFKLPFEARWGLATLPAGDYSFTLQSTSPFSILELYRGTKAVALIRSSGTGDTASSDRSALSVVRDSTGNTVRELTMPEIGMILYYAPHKPARGAAAKEREIAQVIPVTASGK